MTPDPTRPTPGEAIAWLETQERLEAKLLGRTREFPRAWPDEAVADIERRAALSALALDLARDGERFRALEPDGWAVIEVVTAEGDTETSYNATREDALDEIRLVREYGGTATIHPCYLDPAEEVSDADS